MSDNIKKYIAELVWIEPNGVMYIYFQNNQD